MRFLHTSDWHLGRQFHNVSLLNDQRYVLEQIFDIIVQEKIDAVLIAGDIYDRSVPPADAVELLDDVIDKINREFNIPIIIISGNHDGAQRLAFGARQLAASGVHIISQLNQLTQPVILNDEHGEVSFYGIPYADPAAVRNEFDCDVNSHEDAMAWLCSEITSHKKTSQRSVVLSHCFIDGGSESDSERPLSIGGADKVPHHLFSSFDYTALGHLHGPQFKGSENIRYSGSILKYSFSEIKQKKSVSIVNMDAKGSCTVNKIPLIPERDMRIIEGELEKILEDAACDSNTDDYLLVRLLDKQALYEPMAKLRTMYPNILQLEKPNLNQAGDRQLLKRENLKKGELPMFVDFYQQMTGDILDEIQTKKVSDILERIQTGGDK